MTKSLKRMIKYHRQWLESNGAYIFQRDSEDLRRDIDLGTTEAFRVMPGSLSGLGTYFGIRGTIEVIDGSLHGWRHISTAIDCRAWSWVIWADAFFRTPGNCLSLTTQLNIATSLICVSQKWEIRVAKILERVINDPDAIDHKYWRSRTFEPFVLACRAMVAGNSADSSLLKEPYRAIIEHWNDAFLLSDALKTVCDYHCANMDDRGGDWDPEFDQPPFDLLPCEVMLVRRMRKKLELPIPEISHDLIAVLDPPDCIAANAEEHELIREVEEAFQRFIIE